MSDIRSAMFAAAGESIKSYSRECGGRVRITNEQRAMDRDDLRAEASIGCCQKCGCLGAVVEFVTIDGAQYVQARCAADPNALALGDRVLPEPDVPRRKR